MFRQLSIFSKIMFGSVAALLIATVVLGVMTAVKASKGEIGVINTEPSPTSSAHATGGPSPKPTGNIADTEVTPEATPTPAKTYVIAIDPGQQKNQNQDTEPVGPGSSTTVTKMSYGATSTTTKEREYIWTMRMAEMVKQELEARNYKVVLVRESNDDKIDLSNAERAQKANEANADILIGIQLDGANDSSVSGMYFQVASANNPFVKSENVSEAKKLAKLLHDKLIDKTGASDKGIKDADNLAEINWANMPTVVATLGYASNKDEDSLLQSAAYQQKMTGCICDAIDAYLAGSTIE